MGQGRREEDLARKGQVGVHLLVMGTEAVGLWVCYSFVTWYLPNKFLLVVEATCEDSERLSNRGRNETEH